MYEVAFLLGVVWILMVLVKEREEEHKKNLKLLAELVKYLRYGD